MTHIELNTFIKLQGLAGTGGQAKQLIRSGVVFVNGAVETHNRKKLVVGDRVVVDGTVYVVEQELFE